MDIISICSKLRAGAFILAQQTPEQKNTALESVRRSLFCRRDEILKANIRDVEKAAENGMPATLIDRLLLDSGRLDSILKSLDVVIAETDPVGEETAGWITPNGLQIRQERVPLGVAAIIYESRPNVTVDAFCLAYKSGNAILLRGSSSAIETNKALVAAIKDGLAQAANCGVPSAIELSESIDHSDVDQILSATGLIDVVLPRGSAALIRQVTEKAKIPVIQTGSGVCHLYIDSSADLQMAVSIAENGKSAARGCNANRNHLVITSCRPFSATLEHTFQGGYKCVQMIPVIRF